VKTSIPHWLYNASILHWVCLIMLCIRMDRANRSACVMSVCVMFCLCACRTWFLCENWALIWWALTHYWVRKCACRCVSSRSQYITQKWELTNNNFKHYADVIFIGFKSGFKCRRHTTMPAQLPTSHFPDAFWIKIFALTLFMWGLHRFLFVSSSIVVAFHQFVDGHGSLSTFSPCWRRQQFCCWRMTMFIDMQRSAVLTFGMYCSSYCSMIMITFECRWS
jgi:hypothetical protein